jgi:hyperosmotically inducible periplasmic protein
MAIDVDTSKGVVTLDGELQTQAQIDEAMKIAQNTRGVKRVVNELEVAQ